MKTLLYKFFSVYLESFIHLITIELVFFLHLNMCEKRIIKITLNVRIIDFWIITTSITFV